MGFCLTLRASVHPEPVEGGKPERKMKNPFVLAFLIGIAALTVLPFLQRRTLRAPPPLKHLTAFSLLTADGSTFESRSLSGSVWVLSVSPAGCDEACVERQTSLQQVLKATSDLKKPIPVVTVQALKSHTAVLDPALARLSTPGKWVVAYGSYEKLDVLLKELREALWAFRGEGAGGVAPAVDALPGFVLVDQNGDVRGFWGADELARGNMINAARMLNRYGPNP
jgi:cytochrome oxidase Cu insertion factor (SCO1/SenC/PrrC family)